MPTLADKINIWQAHNKKALPWAFALALLYTFTINVFRDYQFAIHQLLPRLLLVFVLLVYSPRAMQKRQLLAFGAFGGLAAFFIVAMRTVLSPSGTPRPWGLWLLPCFFIFAVTYTLCFCGASVLLLRLNLQATAQTPPKRKNLLYIFLGLMVFWLPLFLAYGPVRISADSYVVISQAIGVNFYDDSHPILYTFLVGMFLRPGQALGSITMGAYFFGLTQMAFLALVLAFSVYWMHKNGCPQVLCLFCFFYFALCPVFAINGFTMWKDIPFNACLLLLVIVLFPIAQSRAQWLLKRQNMALFLLLALAICFLRGNGYPLVAVVFGVILLAFRHHAKKLALCFGLFLLFVGLVQGPLYSAFGIGRLGKVEAAGMPIQQVGRAIANGAQLTAQQQQVISSFVPLDVIRENYHPASPDYIKKHPSFNTEAFNANFNAFMGVWAQLLPQNVGNYTNAWLLQTLGYWKFDFGGRTVHIEDDHNGAFGIEYKDFVHKIFGFNLRQFAADRSAFLPLGLMAHVVLFAIAHLVASGQSRKALCFVPLITVWLGLMVAAPTYCDFRYMLVFAFAMPLVFFITLSGPFKEVKA